MAAGVRDLTALAAVTADGIVDVLQARLKAGRIYTNLGGAVVVKVNPFEAVATGRSSGPHVAKLARVARERAVACGKRQSCMMTGESGAGKTEATKVFLNELAGDQFCSNESLHMQLVDSCTLLESFGNCATEHNHNSSRFARWFELRVSRATGAVVSGNVRQYLLEKARVVKGAPSSSNFHVLYDVCAAAASSAGPKDPSAVEQASTAFAYLQDRVDTGRAERWQRTREQLARLGVTPEELEAVEKLLWCVLHLGNLHFEEYGDGCTVADEGLYALGCVSELLGIDDLDAVADLFRVKRLRTGRETIAQPRTPGQATDSRDALAKDIYSRLFRWVVGRINASINGGAWEDDRAEDGELASVGILDVFGFECFEVNSFEQLCINYCNEKLVQQFHTVLVRAELDVCEAEGVPSSRVGIAGEYEREQLRKQQVLAGIDAAFKLIQDETRVPKATDLTLTSKLQKLELGELSNAGRMRGAELFTIAHYAGPVHYAVTGFLEKNKDEGPVDIAEILLARSSSAFLRELFAPPPSPEGAKAPKAAKKKTLGIQFRDEFSELARTLAESEQRFVMCVKPNREAAPKLFERELVMRQLECNGLLTVCSVRKSAFAAHVPHEVFVASYGVLVPGKLSGPPAAAAQTLLSAFLDEMLFDEEDVFMGKTRVLLREPARVLLEMRLSAVTMQVAKVQALVRQVAQRRRFLTLRAAATRLEATMRGRLARRAAHGRQAAALKITAFARVVLAKAALSRLRQQQRALAAARVQALARGRRARLALKHLRAERAATILQSAARRRQACKRAEQEREIRRWRAAKLAATIRVQSFARLVCAKRRVELERAKAAALAFAAREAAHQEHKRKEQEEREREAQAQAQRAAEEQQRQREEQEKLEAQAMRDQRKAAAAAGLAATLAAGGAGAAQVPEAPQASVAAQAVEAPQVSEAKEIEGAKRVEADSSFNQAVMARPVIPKGRRRPSRARRGSQESAQNADALVAAVVVAAAAAEPGSPATAEPSITPTITPTDTPSESPLHTPRECSSPNQSASNSPASTNTSSSSSSSRSSVGLGTESLGPLHEAKAAVLQRAYRCWAARRALQSAWARRKRDLRAAERERSQRLSKSRFAQSSAAFLKAHGETDEAYYEELARAKPELSFLIVDRGLVSGDKHRSSDQSRVRKQLRDALHVRQFGPLAAALQAAYAARYRGPEVGTAEAVVAHLRKIHLKQLEAEKALAAKFGLPVPSF